MEAISEQKIKDYKLIFHIDDVGKNRQILNQVIKFNELGSLKSVSILMNYGEAKEAWSYIKKHPDVKAFWHPNLTTGSPISDPKSVPSLVNSSGQFKYHTTKMALALALRLINPNDIKTELEAQLKLAGQMGIKFRGVDGEQHIQAFEPISSFLISKFNDIADFEFRSLGHLKSVSLVGHLKLKLMRLLARLSSPSLKMPTTWNKPFVDYYMASWEKISLDKINRLNLIVIHPATSFDKINTTLKTDDHPPIKP
ncbi:MAG TPA: ChbG/HpnK family deacetylase [Candidatus Saccharibacteria bacterium]|nr:ChbG/HpnK family deacetylase [Candidatus Saccharibacteria bacterium]